MGTIREFLSFYGHGEEIFSDLIATVEPGLRQGLSSPLCETMQSHGSDKGAGRHNYTFLYKHLFDRFLTNPQHIFELGIGTNYEDIPSNMGPAGVPGASLRGWSHYFRGATVCGADIDRRILFQEPGIQTLYVDQTDVPSILSLWAHLPNQFDIILDDGLHELGANTTFLFNSKHKLKRNGIYIIEDILLSSDNLMKYDKILDQVEMGGFLYRLPHASNCFDNAIAVLVGPKWGHRDTSPGEP